ncbi:MAG: FAD-linked oxidase C-terminal domain-containing protein, partial [Selenomonadaceae bacterium]|nr:FAD-linked oxidase C-terminal domain-containing protein [Selenomonadaceae bacterium]
MEVVLPTGEVVWLGKGGSRKCRNSSAGYRMLELFFGHQGTLGVVTEIVVDCCPKPEVEFPSYYGFASYEEAYNALFQIGISGVKCAVNYIMFDDEKIDFLRRDDEAFIPLPESVKCVVMATFAGTEGEVLAARKKILGIMKKMKGTYLGEEQAWGDWATRHDRYHLAVHCRDGEGQVVTMSWHCEDNCMIHSELPEFTHGLHKIVKKYVDKYDNIFNDAGCFIYCGGPYRTWGDYLAEVDVFINEYAMTPELWEVWLDMKREIAELAVDLGGSISICHGACREGDVDVFIEKECADGQFEMMKKIKKLFDPNNIMNPGKYRLDLAY